MQNLQKFQKTPPAAMSAADLGAELARVERIAPSFPQLGPELESYRDDLTKALQQKLDTAHVS